MAHTQSTTGRPTEKSSWKDFAAALGPGVITGAADDDPSGIATYSMAGAQFGTGLLWTAWFTWPLMACVQMMCARIGMVTGMGLAGALRKKFPQPVLVAFCFALLAANTINVASDLAGMADAAELLTGISSHIFVILFGAGITLALIQFHYHQIASVLKWLALVLAAYILAAFVARPHWGQVFQAVLTIRVPPNGGFATVVAILGTTISPYLFFWQAAQEVEEEKAMGRRLLVSRQGATPHELKYRLMDVGIGTFFSNLVMFFVILMTGVTLNAHGFTTLTTSRQVAQALEPLAGTSAMLLYTIGIVGVGLLAIPTLTGSAAYAFSETFRWRSGLDEKWDQARAFYGVIVMSSILGVGIDFLNIDPLQSLFWTAVINGVLAPFLLIGILIVACDVKIMRGQPSTRLSQIVVAFTIMLMFGAAIGMFLA